MRGATGTLPGAGRTVRFQSTHPVRGATTKDDVESLQSLTFQSTHPVRGATYIKHSLELFGVISIHAPREGCDRFLFHVALFVPFKFQSTHPVRGATLFEVSGASRQAISIHAPREGCDKARKGGGEVGSISIHAPREGCDAGPLNSSPRWVHFNPRTP